MKNLSSRLPALMCLLAGILTLNSCRQPENSDPDKLVIAYVTSWSDIIPDPSLVTHINYAFGHVTDSFDGMRIDNPQRLQQMVALKKQKPQLKVLVSVGGWGSGRFSEMAADEKLRQSFCRSCAMQVEQYGLDGIDIDWEYPTSSAAGISSDPSDRENFTLLMRDLRAALGQDRLLTLASSAGAQYIDFRSVTAYVDLVNIMSYDMADAPKHHSALYSGAVSGSITSDGAVRAHINAGVPVSKIVMGVPFYGRKGAKAFDREKCVVNWDNDAMVPYLTDADGDMVLGYEDVRSLAIKCDYVLQHNLRGVMYWDYADNDSNLSQSRILAQKMAGRKDCSNVLVIAEAGGGHRPFTDAALVWLESQAAGKGFAITVIENSSPVTREFLKAYKAVIQLDFPPYTWDSVSQEAFTDYITTGKGGWIGFHHATLLGEFDGWPMWEWFSSFMGDIVYDNYIAQLSDGTVHVEDATHPVTKGVPAEFLVYDDEWYSYNRSPRQNVRVLATVDEDSYTAQTTVRMGDHPVIWVNENVAAKNVYFQMGHSPLLLSNPAFTTAFSNAISWCLE